jgi:hemerythrin-like metal-binding domain
MEELTLGNPAMDRDHRQMADILDHLMMVADAVQNTDPVVEILTRLAELVRGHFAAEEAAMASMAYPVREAHIAAHRSLIVQLKVLTDVIADGTMEADRSSLEFLLGWLVDHTSVHDRDLARYQSAWLHSRSLQRAANA